MEAGATQGQRLAALARPQGPPALHQQNFNPFVKMAEKCKKIAIIKWFKSNWLKMGIFFVQGTGCTGPTPGTQPSCTSDSISQICQNFNPFFKVNEKRQLVRSWNDTFAKGWKGAFFVWKPLICGDDPVRWGGGKTFPLTWVPAAFNLPMNATTIKITCMQTMEKEEKKCKNWRKKGKQNQIHTENNPSSNECNHIQNNLSEKKDN